MTYKYGTKGCCICSYDLSSLGGYRNARPTLTYETPFHAVNLCISLWIDRILYVHGIPPFLCRYDIARALLARRDLEVDVLDFRDRTPLVMAVQYGYSHLVRLMLIAGADPSTGE